MTEQVLFEGYEALPLAPAEKLSADQRRTLRQHRDVASGVHPLTGTKARPDLGTCGTCQFREPSEGFRSWPKCLWSPGPGLGYPRVTSGAASDCRAWWPACADYEPKASA